MKKKSKKQQAEDDAKELNIWIPKGHFARMVAMFEMISENAGHEMENWSPPECFLDFYRKKPEKSYLTGGVQEDWPTPEEIERYGLFDAHNARLSYGARKTAQMDDSKRSSKARDEEYGPS